MKPLHENRDANRYQKREGQYFKGGVLQNKLPDGFCKGENGCKRKQHRRDNDPQRVCETDGRYNRVYGEHDVQKDYLRDDGLKAFFKEAVKP